MAGLDPAIHVFGSASKTWMPGTRPGMTMVALWYNYHCHSTPAVLTDAKKIKVTKSNGNIFADIGIPNADQHFVKAEIVLDIAARIKGKRLTQSQAAKIMGLSQPDVSKLLRGNFAGYTLDRLFSFLRALGNDVRIQIVPTKGKRAGQIEFVGPRA